MCTRTEITDQIEKARADYDYLKSEMEKVLLLVKDKYPALWFQSRLKSVESLFDKVNKRKVESLDQVSDIIGFRFIYPWTMHLFEIAHILTQMPSLAIIDKKITERDKVIYLFGYGPSHMPYEVQLWPTLIYTCFEFEHDRIYKPQTQPSDLQRFQAQFVREQEHILQDYLDQHVLVPY